MDENGFDVPRLDHAPVVSGPPGPLPRKEKPAHDGPCDCDGVTEKMSKSDAAEACAIPALKAATTRSVQALPATSVTRSRPSTDGRAQQRREQRAFAAPPIRCFDPTALYARGHYWSIAQRLRSIELTY